MIIAALKEYADETRVAITPNAIKHYLKLGFEVICEKNAGVAAGFANSDYELAGARIINSRLELLQITNVLLCVNEPSPTELEKLPAQALVIGHIDNQADNALVVEACKHRISLFSMNLIPRISRAQSMDSLSSQANLAGYRAVLEGIHHFRRAVPMMMTAAGMIQPAKILILGAGVAGLQAIATAKRLGGIVYAFDVRRAAKEQVESLGAEFIELAGAPDNETTSGYAREMSDEYKALQAELVHKYATLVDIIVCTALIPGKKAPLLVFKTSIEKMKPGSVIVDIATSRGGNCELSQRDKTILYNNVTLVGNSNLAGLVPATASELYSGNLTNLMRLLTKDPSTLVFDPADEIIRQAMLCHEGHYLPFQHTREPSA